MDCKDDAARLVLSDVSANYNGRQVLDHVDLRVEAGEIHGLVNRQHDERSMPCKAITGELGVCGGGITFSGVDITGLSARETFKLGIDYSGGQPMLQTGMTVADNLALGGVWSARRFFTRRSLNAEIQAWLDAEGFSLEASQRVLDLPYSDHALVEILNRLRRDPKLLIVDATLDRLSEGLGGYHPV